MTSPETGNDVEYRDQDTALVRRMIDGDRHALARLYDAYAPAVLAVAVRILGERQEAEDIVHDIFVEAWCRAHTYDPSRGSVRTWLLVKARSRALDRSRSAGVRRTVSWDAAAVAESPAAPGEDPALAADRRAVLRALRDLPAEQRTVLVLGYFEGLSSREIAARVAAPVGTVKSRVAAALAKLRLELSAVREEVA